MSKCYKCGNPSIGYNGCQICAQSETLKEIAAEASYQNDLLRHERDERDAAPMRAAHAEFMDRIKPTFVEDSVQKQDSIRIDQMIEANDITEEVKGWIAVLKKYNEVTNDEEDSIAFIRRYISKESGVDFVSIKDVEDYLVQYKKDIGIDDETENGRSPLDERMQSIKSQLIWGTPIVIFLLLMLTLISKH